MTFKWVEVDRKPSCSLSLEQAFFLKSLLNFSVFQLVAESSQNLNMPSHSSKPCLTVHDTF